MWNKYKFLIYALLIGACMGLFSSCRDDDIITSSDDQDEQIFVDIPSLTVTLTLDNLGGEPAPFSLDPAYDDLVKAESYLDPQKCRILFFDSEDNFLFESKSRYVKKLETTSGEAGRWTVTVPFFTYGNDGNHSYDNKDLDYDWDWKAIKAKLTSKPFKIAIMANHPERDFNMGIKGRTLNSNGGEETSNIDADVVVADQWYRNDGPNWTHKNSVCYTGADKDVKTIIDLHHCQRDLIYKGKNHDQYHPYNASGYTYGEAHVAAYHANLGFYDVICEYDPSDTQRQYPLMGPTVGWVDFQDDDSHKDSYNLGQRTPRMPSEDFPIPMYGIQTFDEIDPAKWIDGSTYRLDRPTDKAISLLRSCVKLELFIPSDYTVDRVVLLYSNVYSRCEPLNIWDPTETIWTSGHDLSKPGTIAADDCEWKRIWKFGPMTAPSSLSTKQQSKDSLQKKLAWQYRNWGEVGWHFGRGKNNVEAGKAWANQVSEFRNLPSPNVFNPLVQRNNYVVLEKGKNFFYDVPGYIHIVTYTGERAVNDGSNLTNIGNTGSGNPVAAYWEVCLKKKNSSNGYRLSMAITDYSSNAAKAYEVASFSNGTGYPPPLANSMGGTGKYFQRVQSKEAGTPMPYPLLRNHTYKMTLTGNGFPNNATKGSDDVTPVFNINSEVKFSPSISFQRAMPSVTPDTDAPSGTHSAVSTVSSPRK